MTITRGFNNSNLITESLDDLASEVFAKARRRHGYVVTYSPKVFIP